MISLNREKRHINKTKNLKKFTVEEKIFLFLLDNNYLKERHIIPDFLTEQGIKKVLKCDLGYISRILRKNENEGLIERKLLRIKNKNRKQNVFFLTRNGLDFALELKKDANDFKFKIKKNNSTQKKIFEYN